MLSTQRFSGKNTSVNKYRVPAIFKRVDWTFASKYNFDLGGGKYDTASVWLLENHGITNLIYDPFNRSPRHNIEILEKVLHEKILTVTVSNVLNILETKEQRAETIRLAYHVLSPGGRVYFKFYTVKEAGVSKPDCFQTAMKPGEYLPEILSVFPKCELIKGLIVATKPD